MPNNIKDIKLSTDLIKKNRSNVPLVKINFNYLCDFTYLNIEDLKEILKLWIWGEELVYHQGLGFKGRWLLFEEIKNVFDSTPQPTMGDVEEYKWMKDYMGGKKWKENLM